MGIRIHLVGSKNEVYNDSGHGYLFCENSKWDIPWATAAADRAPETLQ